MFVLIHLKLTIEFGTTKLHHNVNVESRDYNHEAERGPSRQNADFVARRERREEEQVVANDDQ